MTHLFLIWVFATLIATPNQQPVCRAAGEMTRLQDLPEASGIAASRRTPGIFWAHNDSAEPVVFALDERGRSTRRVRIADAGVADWEDIAVGPCPQGSCLYIADIGDNNGSRDHIRLYRAPEPTGQETSTRPVEVFEAVYPDGAHDAEALFVTSRSDVYIITKGDPGPVALYRFPGPLKAGTRVRLQRVGAPATAADDVDAKDRPTAADVSPDGRWVAVRTTDSIAFYRTTDLTSGRWNAVFRTDVSGLREPRGEGITFAGNDTVVLIGEGGGLARSGTFARLACTFPP